MRQVFVLAALAASLFVGTRRHAEAAPVCDVSKRCSCPGLVPTVAQSVARARDVFSGTVIAVRDSSERRPGSRFVLPINIATVVVESRWKGASGDTLDVPAYRDESMCGMVFTVGERWLIFIDSIDGKARYGHGVCAHSALLHQAGSTLQALGAPATLGGLRSRADSR